jgi:hypothetical protein
MIKSKFLIFILFSLLFCSCRKDMDKTSWDTEVIAPLINASLNINNLLPDSILQTNPDSSLKIVYKNNFYNLSMDTLFKIPNTTLHQAYATPFPYTFSAGQQVVPTSISETTYNLQGVQLRTITVKNGLVKYSIKSMIHEVTDFVYSIPSAKLNGVPFSINVSVPAAVGTTPGIYSKTFDLSGYIFDLTGNNHSNINTISTSLSASVSPLGQAVLVNPADSLVIDNTFYNIFPHYAKGYFGQNTFNIGPVQSNFTMFERLVGGIIKLEDVSINLKIENPIGLDSRIYINNLSSINTRTGQTVNLANSIVGSPTNINRAAESGGVVYQTVANFPLNTSNSNIKNMIENLPDKLGYNLQLSTNPLGNVSGSNDFIYSDKLLKVGMEMEIPLSLMAKNLILVDTLNIDISNNNGAQNIKSATITLFADNGFPFDAGLQFYLLNDHNIIADSLFGYANVIDEAPINSSLRVISTKLTKIVIPVNESKINLLYNTKKIMIKMKFNTSAQPNYIKIYSDYTIGLKLVGDFNYTIKVQ